MKSIGIIVACFASFGAQAVMANTTSTTTLADIEVQCEGQLEVESVADTNHVLRERPSRVTPPPLDKWSEAEAIGKIVTMSPGCAVLVEKYGIDFAAASNIALAIDQFGWVDLAAEYTGKVYDFQWKHYVSYVDAEGTLPLFPYFAQESLHFRLDSRYRVEAPDLKWLRPKVQELYGSLALNTFAERKLGLVVLRGLLADAPDWYLATKSSPWVSAADRVQPRRYRAEDPAYDSPEMQAAFAEYLAVIEQMMADLPFAELIVEHPAQWLVREFGSFIALELSTWGGSLDPDIRLTKMKQWPVLLHPEANPNLVSLTSKIKLAEWQAFLDHAETVLAGDDQAALEMQQVLAGLRTTRWIGISASVYERIDEILGSVAD